MLPPDGMMMSGSRLSPRAMSVFIVLLQTEAVLISVADIITKGHAITKAILGSNGLLHPGSVMMSVSHIITEDLVNVNHIA